MAMHLLQRSSPSLCVFRAVRLFSIAQRLAIPVVTAEINEDETRRNSVLDQEVQMSQPVRILVVGPQPAIHVSRKAIGAYGRLKRVLDFVQSALSFRPLRGATALEFLDMSLGFNEEVLDPGVRLETPDRIPVWHVARLGPELQPSGFDP